MGIHLPRVKFSTTLFTISVIFTIFISWLCFLCSFFRTTNWRKVELEKSIETNLQEAERQFLNMLASPIPQYFSRVLSVPSLQNDQTSILKLTEELFVSPSVNLKTCWTHNLHKFSKSRFLHSLSRTTIRRKINRRWPCMAQYGPPVSLVLPIKA